MADAKPSGAIKEVDHLKDEDVVILPDYLLNKKLEAARALLAKHDMYIAHDAASLGYPRFEDRLKTAGVCANKYGGIDFLWNRKFLSKLDLEDVAFTNAHEIHHVTAGHVYTQKENHKLWNICCDVFVNTWLIHAAKLPCSEYFREHFLWTAEKINMDPQRLLSYASADDLYKVFESKTDLVNELLKEYDKSLMSGDMGLPLGDPIDVPGDSSDSVLGDPADRSAGATPDEHQGWGKIDKSHVDNFIERLKERGCDPGKMAGHGSMGMFRAFQEVEQNFAWERELSRFVGSIIRHVETYERPHRRITPGFPKAIIPYVKDREEYYIAVYVDMSGSIGKEEVNRFVSVLKRAPKSITFEYFSFDDSVYPWNFKDYPRGGGGTNFQAVVNHSQGLKKRVDATVVLTDGYCGEPQVKRPAKWLWISTGSLLTSKSGRWVKMPPYRGSV